MSSVENNLNNIKKFINHNLNQKYITKDTNIEELLEFINKIENNYLPVLKTIEEDIKELR